MKYKVLIVDDEKLLRQGFIHMADWSKYQFLVIGEAANGLEAIQMIEEKEPDIVVTDIRMPRMNGIELTRIIKEKYPDIQIIILSSYNDFEYVKETLKMGAVDYILKPKMQFEELLNTLLKAKERIVNKAYVDTVNRSTDDHRIEDFADRNNNQLFYGVENTYSSLPIEFLKFDFKQFKNVVQLLDDDLLHKEINSYTEQFISQGLYLYPMVLKKNVIEIFYYIFHKLNDLGIDIHGIEENKLSYFSRLDNARNYQEFLNSIRTICNDIENSWNEGYEVKSSIDGVLVYMEENFQKQITLDIAAKHFHFNKSYLCQLFKNQTGESFNQYLTMLRVDKAKTLLRKTDDSIYSICREIGYTNSSYFGKVFKKIVGISPSEYSELYSAKKLQQSRHEYTLKQ